MSMAHVTHTDMLGHHWCFGHRGFRVVGGVQFPIELEGAARAELSMSFCESIAEGSCFRSGNGE